MVDGRSREWNRSHEQSRRHGAMGNLNRGIVISVRGQWVTVGPGDLAFIPPAVPRGLRNPAGNAEDFVLVNQISPPQFDTYEAGGYYDRERGKMNFDAIEAAKKQSRWANLAEATDVDMRETHPKVRAWNLPVEEICRGGALFNVMQGARFGDLGTPMLLVLWPGYGVRSAGLHMGDTPAGARAEIHTHPTSDECLFNWVGRGEAYCGGRSMEEDPPWSALEEGVPLRSGAGAPLRG